MGNLYVKNGTPIGSVSLCLSCSNGHTIEGYRESEAIQICTYDRSMTIPFRVKSCSNHHDKNKPTWLQMQKLAIPVDARRTFKPVGFLLQPAEEVKSDGNEFDEYDDE